MRGRSTEPPRHSDRGNTSLRRSQGLSPASSLAGKSRTVCAIWQRPFSFSAWTMFPSVVGNQRHICLILLVFLVSVTITNSQDNAFDPDVKPIQVGEAQAPRYLLYDVNPGEGFNLRRDVYMRIANLVRNLNEDAPWILVLPPWGRLYHWKSQHLHQIGIPWSTFFDLASLRKFVPVIEFEELLQLLPTPVIDELYYLQSYQNWKEWEEKMEIQDCLQNPYRRNEETGRWKGWFFGFGETVSAEKFACMSVMGHASSLKPFLLKNTTGSTVMIDRGEVVLHDRFGDTSYWECRRSMRFSKPLRQLGDAFRETFLDSTDEADNTVLDEDWTKMKRKHGEAKGGPYLAAHLRRADFAHVREKDVPSLKYTAKQLKSKLEEWKLTKLFIATDASSKEFEKLKGYLDGYEVFRYEPPSEEVHETYKDGGLAIIDQWICAHARYFIGTRESTFSFRIQDEREILGFDPDTTFNCLCGDKKKDKECEQPSRWKIVY
ncbi:hypothetical protein BaRGS_00000993 [Batillaria attramentaria]|uniref:GDP-fucose protein O-fucosyltransferase 2 n=1 Tax=Batillaria attramentaria TaxID=370345 RepID=A0ABD0M882_9CAEN